jgi:hypothetical protein
MLSKNKLPTIAMSNYSAQFSEAPGTFVALYNLFAPEEVFLASNDPVYDYHPYKL